MDFKNFLNKNKLIFFISMDLQFLQSSCLKGEEKETENEHCHILLFTLHIPAVTGLSQGLSQGLEHNLYLPKEK